MVNLTRRGFIGAAAAMGVGTMGSIALGDEKIGASGSGDAPATVGEFAEDKEFVPGGGSYADGMIDNGWKGTPADIAALGGSTMPLDELNRRRQAYVDAQTDYKKQDGTVVPKVYVQARCIVHSYGMGCGNTPVDDSFDYMMQHFTEDEMQGFVDMPMGTRFTPLDFSAKTGRSLELCKRLCQLFADDGFLVHGVNEIGDYYHEVPYFQGVVEYHLKHFDSEDPTTFTCGIVGADMLGPKSDMELTGTPTFYVMPVNEDVVSDEGGIRPYDDIMKVIDACDSFAIAPCYCRYTALKKSGEDPDMPSIADFLSGDYEDYFSPLCNQRMETCLQLGEEADYWVESGHARRITKQEAIEFMERSVKDGFILESNFSKYTGTVCSCHEDSCGIIAEWNSLGSHEAIGSSKPFRQISHYVLNVDFDSCIRCGACAARCPMHAITMDGEHEGESGYPQVDPACFKCGQCAYVCPQGARKLAARPDEENCALPQDFLDDDNMKAAYRFEHGLI
jgi:NAD-dependent dihydropyrimidine dehydrogenase PreA subunit